MLIYMDSETDDEIKENEADEQKEDEEIVDDWEKVSRNVSLSSILLLSSGGSGKPV